MTKLQKLILGLGILPVFFLIYTMIASSFVRAEDFTQCGFYIENGTCEAMTDRCKTEVTEMLKGMNYRLQGELEQCEKEIGKGGFSKIVTLISVSLLIFFLVRDSIRRRKETH